MLAEGNYRVSKRIEVSIANQQLKAFENSKVVHTFDCITGDSEHPTNTGTFHIFSKDKNHVSHKYHVKMHYAMFFTHDGKAIHQYHGPAFSSIRLLKEKGAGWFGSHGCVRLREEDANSLFSWAPIHTMVLIR